jgi:putative membrane protein
MITKIVLSTFGAMAICAVPLCAQSTSISKSDVDFLRLAAEADMTTANLAQTAETRADSPQVKDFAKKLTTEHTNDYAQLSEVATKTGETIPKAIDKQDNREIATLDRAKGKAFDREFLSHQTAEHEKLLRAFRQEAEHGTNPDVKAYASKGLPVMEAHLHDAQDLLKSKV